jgi:hypothetical protein
MPFAIRLRFATDQGLRGAMSVPPVVARFDTHEAANAECARLEAARRCGCPFGPWPQASIRDLTGLEPPVLCDWMLDIDLFTVLELPVD